MPVKIQIALQVPSSDPSKMDRFFLLRLKQELEKEMPISKRTDRTFVVSDTGGDFLKFCRILYYGNVIDENLKWTFGDGRLVVLGNCLDDNSDVVECLWLIYALEEKARKKGGHVHFILGNKEVYNLNGDWRFKHPRYAISSGIRMASTALYDGSNELWRWLKTKNLVERIGHILFVHGSVSMNLLCTGLSIGEINNIARLRTMASDQIFASPSLRDGIISEKIEDRTEEQINAILKHFNAKTIVSGYEQGQKVDLLYNGRVINVHTDHVNGLPEGLLIKRRHFYRISGIKKPERIL